MARPTIPNIRSVIFCTITMHNVNEEFFIASCDVNEKQLVNFSEIVNLETLHITDEHSEAMPVSRLE
jgi:hypothetical protein